MMFRDAAGRLAHKEASSIRRILKSQSDTRGQIDAWLGKHEECARLTLGPVWRAIAVATGGTECVDKTVSQYMNSLRSVLAACDTDIEMHKLVLLWDENRANNLTIDWMEAGYECRL